MTMADGDDNDNDGTMADTNEANPPFTKEENPPVGETSKISAENIEQESNEMNDDNGEAPSPNATDNSSSLANAFVVGSNLSLSPSRDSTHDNEEEGNNALGLIVEEETAVSEEKKDTPISPPSQEKRDASMVVSDHSLMDDDEDSNDDDDDDDDTEQEKAAGQEIKTESPTENGRAGAQILMNRFSSWREKANEAIKVNRFSTGGKKETDQDHSDLSESQGSDSSAGSSLASEEVEKSRKTMEEDYAETQRRTAVAVKVAASSVMDTVASGFRGRYSGGGTPQTPMVSATPRNKQQHSPAGTQSQTALIMQSRAKAHMQSILDSLEPQEYVMLLGNGMLGVNLKQAYLKNNGVYIDFLVQGGSAEMSGVVSVGDNLMKVGDVDVFRRGLILNVPQTIAAAKRPVVLVLSTGQEIPVERMNYIDVAVGMMHKIRQDKNNHRDIASMPIHSQEDEPAADMSDESVEKDTDTSASADDEAADATASPNAVADKDTTEEKAVNVTVSVPSFDGPNPMAIGTPPLKLREQVSAFVAKRCFDNFSLSMLCQAATTDANFRAVLQNAFVTCVYDGRRLPFLSSHFSYQESFDNGDDSDFEEDVQMTTASTQLMLFLELTTFLETYSITPEATRRDAAKRIASKFFLPTKLDNSLEPPMFDFHHIVPDADLRALEHALNDMERPVGRDIFIPFQKAIMESLSGPPFITFLISVECARMRAYLRNTAPFQSVCPGEIFAGVEKRDFNMENRLQYLLMHLICQIEREIGDEHDGLSGDSQERVMGAVGGIACAVYIKQRLLNAMKEARTARESESKDDDRPYVSLIEGIEVFWETFIAPAGGMLDSISNSAETDIALNKVRQLLKVAVMPSTANQSVSEEELVKDLTSSELCEACSSLSDQLLHDYAVNTYSKFKEHRFHEWLCNEVDMTEGPSDFQKGCIRRLIRKAQLPSGVTPHKPIRLSVSQSSATSPAVGDMTTEDGAIKCRNAEFAVVFGTDDGSGEVDPVPNPAMNRTDIRRYVCQAVVDEKDSPGASSFRVPQTLESYVTVPLHRRIPFSDVADDCRVSADGWEISLVNFMVPNAGTTSDNHDEKALFGVSLVFQKRGESLTQASNKIQETELVHEAGPPQEIQNPPKSDCGDTRPFASPLRFVTASGDKQDVSNTKRVIQVSSASPVFNRRLQESSWSERMNDRQRVVAGPVTVGIALACRRNVVPAMRESLTRFLLDQARSSEETDDLLCGPLVELLGNFSHPDVEASALNAILEPYITFGSSSWIDKPLEDQQRHFEIVAGQQLIDCLPPIPLALLFVTLLLEQKVVLSSSRRSVLFSAVTSLTELFKPLKWSHLLVPLVPSALARDLLQYPAPFILGIPSEDPGNMETLNALPNDVTLVDLDVGRVILASHFAHDDELVRDGEDPRVTAAALRSQVLYLAQSLGLLFGSKLRRQTWNVDSLLYSRQDDQAGLSDIEKLRAVCRSFLAELLTGTESCCFWIEEREQDREGHSQPSRKEEECTVLFDEDRFFHIKNLRARGRYKPLFETGSPLSSKYVDYDMGGPMSSEDGLALSLDDFDLILETFLRCQSMSTYVSSRSKGRMAYV